MSRRNKQVYRSAIRDYLKNRSEGLLEGAGEIDMDLVDARQTRKEFWTVWLDI